jgi:hypothetical protein
MAGNGTRVKSLEQRLWEKISPEPNSGCWLWTGYADPLGYGQTYVDGRVRWAHRAAYEFYVGKIPDGLVLDHKCRVPCCVNPDHLEPVTQKVNVRRGLVYGKTHCKLGHQFDEANTYLNPRNGSKSCKACRAMRAQKPERREWVRNYMRDRYARKRAALAPDV